MGSPTPRTKVFISYSHNDREWLDRLQVHVKPLVREGLEIWDDTRIMPGARWNDEIQSALDAAKVAVLLVSADFLASDYIADTELSALLAAAEHEGAVILPVIISSSWFSKTQVLDERDQQAVRDRVAGVRVQRRSLRLRGLMTGDGWLLGEISAEWLREETP